MEAFCIVLGSTITFFGLLSFAIGYKEDTSTCKTLGMFFILLGISIFSVTIHGIGYNQGVSDRHFNKVIVEETPEIKIHLKRK